jgi:hypothetical protein
MAQQQAAREQPKDNKQMTQEEWEAQFEFVQFAQWTYYIPGVGRVTVPNPRLAGSSNSSSSSSSDTQAKTG